MHRSHLPLKTSWPFTQPSNGKALQLHSSGSVTRVPGSCKLRRAMVDPDRSLLEDLRDREATLPFRTVKDPTAGGQGRSPQGRCALPARSSYRPRASHVASGWRRSISPPQPSCPPGPRRRARGNHRWLERLLRPPDHDHQPRSSVQRSPISCSWIHRVFSNLKRFGTFHHLRRYLDEFVSAGTAAATPQRPSTPCSASARASDPPTTATSSDNAADPGRPGASHRPPSDPPQSGPSAGPPACLTALETNFPKPKSSRTSPGTVQEPCLERRRPINIWCDRKQREKPFIL